MQEAPTVSILIPAYNEEAYIESCIKSISSQDTSFRYEIVVCDDCSTDATPQILERLDQIISELRTITNDINRGIIKTCNRLIETARGKYFVRIDADSRLIPHSLERIQSNLMGGYSLVFGKIEVKNTNYLHPAAAQVGKLKGRSTWYGGACFACDTQAFIDSGAFDEEMIGAEVQELKQRAQRLDWSVAYLDEAGVESNFPTALRPVLYRKYDSTRSHIRQYKNDPEEFNLWEVRGPMFWTIFIIVGLTSIILPILTLLSIILLVVPFHQYVRDAPLAASVSGRRSFLLLYPLYEAVGGIVRMFGLWSDIDVLVNVMFKKYM